jgi:hypothetical protein
VQHHSTKKLVFDPSNIGTQTSHLTEAEKYGLVKSRQEKYTSALNSQVLQKKIECGTAKVDVQPRHAPQIQSD